jgi:hypothetical protein
MYTYWTTPEHLHFIFVKHHAKPLQLRMQYPCWDFVNRSIENLVFHNLKCKTSDVSLVDSFIQTKAAQGLLQPQDEYVSVVFWFLTETDPSRDTVSTAVSLVPSPAQPPTPTPAPKGHGCCWSRRRDRVPTAVV